MISTSTVGGGGTHKLRVARTFALHSRARLPKQKRVCNRGVFFPMSEKSIGVLACRCLTQDKPSDDPDHINVFANVDAAEKWFADNDHEGVAFEHRSPRRGAALV
jgi:hypothetical protein